MCKGLEMQKEKIVEVKNVSMMFNLAKEKVDNIKEFVIRKLKGTLHYEEFWALRDVSVDIYRGEPLGIIGFNGSGKSTLLKNIAGVMKPTKGEIFRYGNITPLIELGAGFDPDFSARENVFLNGAILGYTRKIMAEKLDEIIEFAELQEFIDVPVKNYSSGMVARLAFSIAVANPADILIVDEILSVGDYKFREKSFERIKEIIDSGSTVIMVSHQSSQVKDICKKALWLDHGKVIDYGDSAEICDKYEPLSEEG